MVSKESDFPIAQTKDINRAFIGKPFQLGFSKSLVQPQKFSLKKLRESVSFSIIILGIRFFP